MKKKTPILDYYYACLERRKKNLRLDRWYNHLGEDDSYYNWVRGLCESKIRTKIAKSFGPIGGYISEKGKLTPLRENMILLCAAFHNEL